MSNSYFEVLRAGVNTTYQDKGRFGMQHMGLPPSGCSDNKSFLVANALTRNENPVGVIEFAYQGPLLKLIKGKTKIAITGNVNFKIIYKSNEIIEGDCNRSYNLDEGDQIDILATKETTYGYFSIEGGFNLESFRNSVSTLVKAKIGPKNEAKIKLGEKKKLINIEKIIIIIKVIFIIIIQM